MGFSEWKEYKLGEIYEFSSGLSKSRGEFGSGYEFLSFKDVFYNYFVPEKLTELVNSSEKERQRCSIKRGDVFLTRTSETQDELGMSSVALKEYGNATFNGFTKRLRPKSNVEILPEYVGYYFRGPKFRNEITSMSSMTTRASLNNDMMSILKLVLPPLDEQKEIAKILFALDKKIETNNKINQNLQSLSQLLFKHWFVDFEFPNEEGLPYKSTGGEMVDSELGMIPKGWKVKTLKDIVEISTKSINPQNNVDTLYEHYSIPAFDEKKYPAFEFGKDIKSSKYVLDSQCVLLSKLNPTTKRLWYPNLFTNNAVCSTEFIVYKPISVENLGYSYALLDSQGFNDFMASIASGSTNSRQRSKPSETLFYKMPYSDNYVIEFSIIINKALELIAANREENAKLSTLRDTLLPKLMSGEIDISSLQID